MAVTRGPRTGVVLWSADTDPIDRTQFDSSHRALEENVALDRQGTLADRGPVGPRGTFYSVTSGTGLGDVYRSDGTNWVLINPRNLDHGTLPGLGDDDHPQYLTHARHGQYSHDGTPLHGPHNVLHGQLGDLDYPGFDDHPVYLNAARHAALHTGGGATTVDHGTLTGLGDDDHPQYLTTGRGDARYIARSVIASSGDLLVGSGTGLASRLSRGAARQVLRVRDNGTIGWSPATGASMQSLRTANAGLPAGTMTRLQTATWPSAPAGQYQATCTAVLGTASGNTPGTLRITTNNAGVSDTRCDIDTLVQPHTVTAVFSHVGGNLAVGIEYVPNSTSATVFSGTTVVVSFVGYGD